MLERVKAEISDLYPPIPDPTADQQPPTADQYALDLDVPAVGRQRSAS